MKNNSSFAEKLLEKKQKLKENYQSKKDNSSIEGEQLTHEEFWKREGDRIDNGLWVNGKLIETAQNYFIRVFIRINSSDLETELFEKREQVKKDTLFYCNEARTDKSILLKLDVERP